MFPTVIDQAQMRMRMRATDVRPRAAEQHGTRDALEPCRREGRFGRFFPSVAVRATPNGGRAGSLGDT